MERRIREINQFTVGWTAYFSLIDHPRPLRDLDEWLRRRLRQARWKEWKRYRTRRRKLIALGIPDWQAAQWAATRKGYWRLAGSAPLHRAMPNAYWANLGLRTFTDNYRRLRDAKRTAGCGPGAGWCGGRRGKPGAYPIDNARSRPAAGSGARQASSLTRDPDPTGGRPAAGNRPSLVSPTTC